MYNLYWSRYTVNPVFRFQQGMANLSILESTVPNNGIILVIKSIMFTLPTLQALLFSSWGNLFMHLVSAIFYFNSTSSSLPIILTDPVLYSFFWWSEKHLVNFPCTCISSVMRCFSPEAPTPQIIFFYWYLYFGLFPCLWCNHLTERKKNHMMPLPLWIITYYSTMMLCIVMVHIFIFSFDSGFSLLWRPRLSNIRTCVCTMPWDVSITALSR